MEKEKREARINLMLTPQNKTAIETLAAIQKTSVNNLINQVLGRYIKANGEILQKYNSFIDTLSPKIEDEEIDSSLFEDN